MKIASRSTTNKAGFGEFAVVRVRVKCVVAISDKSIHLETTKLRH
jgi:hypothetical protein